MASWIRWQVEIPAPNPVFLLEGRPMDIIKGDTKKLYFRYLGSAFGSALISSLYSLVDMIAVGQYHGSSGSAALAVVAPIWNVIYSLGLLTGMGGAILFSKIKGDSSSKENPNSFFTTSIILTAIFSAIVLILLWVLEDQILILFGSSESLLPLCESYLYYVRFAVPVFLFNQMLAAFLRNDKDPALATGAILFGGVFNVAGDYLLVFTANLGIMGAGIATVACNVASLLVMLTHFLKKKNTLRLAKPTNFLIKSKDILVCGFPAFFTDTAMGILTVVYNRQIGKYFDEDHLAVYGVIINISTFVQCCAYGVGQAAQPLLSENYGAKKSKRVKSFLFYSLMTILVITVLWVVGVMCFPNSIVSLLMKPNEHVLEIAPSMIRIYALAFIFLPFNVFSTYFFQATMKPLSSFLVSFLRGLAISVPLLFLLPLIKDSLLFYVIPITELLVFALALTLMIVGIKKMPKEETEPVNKASV